MAIVTRQINYAVGGDNFVGYLAVDDATDDPKPGVLVVHEWWGHDDYARARAEQLAGDGFAGFALDMYGDAKVAGDPEEAAALMNSVTGTPGAIEQRFDAALKTLQDQPEADPDNISAIGYCFGGAVVLGMARAGKPLKVVSSFHGLLQTESPLQRGTFAGRIAVFNGADDPMVTPEIANEFEAEMQAAGADYTFKSYPGVVHGFSNPAATGRGEKYEMPLAYNAEADADSYAATVALMRN